MKCSVSMSDEMKQNIAILNSDKIKTENEISSCEENKIEKIELSKCESVNENVDGEITVLSNTCYYLKGQCENVKTDFLLDCGSTFTIVDYELYMNIPQKYRSDLEPCDIKLKSANGSLMKIHGESKMKLKIGSHYFEKNVKIVDLGDKSAILGLDFMEQENCCCWFAKGTLQIRSRHLRIPLFKMKDKSMTCARVQIIENLIIKPNQEVLVKGKLHGKDVDFIQSSGYVEAIGSWGESKQIFVAKAVVDVVDNTVPLRILNLSEKEVKIDSGHSLAKIHEIDNANIRPFENAKIDCDTICSVGINNDENVQMPEHLEPLIENLPDEITEKQKNEIKQIICNYSSCFLAPNGKIGRTNVMEHCIDLVDQRPIKMRYRDPPLHVRSKVDEEIIKMQNDGLIEDSFSAFSAPMVVVPKKSGEIRICCDFRKLNMNTIKSAQNIPKISACLDSLSGAYYICTLDCASGYHQIPMCQCDKEKTAFSTRLGLKQWTVMPFGLCSAPLTFTKCMEKLFYGLQWHNVLIYLDDVISFGRDFEEMKQVLCNVLDRFKSGNLLLKSEKCKLFQSSCDFLGFIVSRDGIKCDPKKIECIKNWKVCESVKEVRQFVGFCQYYRRFIKHFSHICKPLHDLTKKNVRFQWNEKCQHAFDTLKAEMSKPPVLAYPNETDTFILDTDASNFAAGAVLSQVQDGVERPIAFGSKIFSKTQTNMCTTMRELCAIMLFTAEYRRYLCSKKFLLRTDHASLVWLTNFKEPSGVLFRWLQKLSEYSYEIIHRKGVLHTNCDSLSRMENHKQRKCKRDDCPDCTFDVKECVCSISNDHSIIEANDNENCVCFPAKCNVVTRQQSKLINNTNENVLLKNEKTNNVPDEDNLNGDVTQTNSEFVPLYESNWFDNFSHNDIERFQNEDAIIGDILKLKKERNDAPDKNILKDKDREFIILCQRWENLEIHGDILYRKYCKNKNQWLQIVVPSRMRKDILQLIHNHKTAANVGQNKVFDRLQRHFYWPGYKADVDRWCSKCKTCEQMNEKLDPKKAPLHSKPSFHRMDRVSIDIMKVPISNEGHIGIMVASCEFTKYSEFYALKECSAYTCADILCTQFFARFGYPLQLHSDGAKNFESDLMKELCQILDIHKTKTARYRPQGNAVIERNNRTLKKMLRSVVDENPDSWHEFLPYLQQAFNSSIHQTTKCTPNLLMFGTENRTAIELVYGDAILESPRPQCISKYVQWIRDVTSESYAKARKYLDSSIARNKTYYDKNCRMRHFNVGNWVWVLNSPDLKIKTGKRWIGPYLVVGKLGDVDYKLQKAKNGHVCIVHIDHIKLYEHNDTPECWLQLKKDKSTVSTQTTEQIM